MMTPNYLCSIKKKKLLNITYSPYLKIYSPIFYLQ